MAEIAEIEPKSWSSHPPPCPPWGSIGGLKLKRNMRQQSVNQFLLVPITVYITHRHKTLLGRWHQQREPNLHLEVVASVAVAGHTAERFAAGQAAVAVAAGQAAAAVVVVVAAGQAAVAAGQAAVAAAQAVAAAAAQAGPAT